MPHDVFLSYASTDRGAAEAICAALEARGIRCWVAPRDVPAGADWGEAILTAIGRAHAMVLVLSRTTANSVHVRNEVVTAVSQSLALVPVRVEDCQPGGALRLHLAGSHWLNVYPLPVEQHADALAAGVRLALAADETIEIPRAQAAAMVAAARASHAAARPPAPLPVSAMAPRPAMRPLSPSPARPQAIMAAPAAAPQRRTALAIALGLGAAALLVALGVAAWFLDPRVRGLIGAATEVPAALAGVAPPTDMADMPPPASAVPELPPRLAARLVPATPPPRTLPDDETRPRSMAPSGSLAGLNGGAPLPHLAAAPRTLAPGSSLAGVGGGIALPSTPAPAPFAPASIPDPAATPAPPARLMNVGRETISRLLVGRAGNGPGRDDWLGNAQLTPGNAVHIRAPQGQGCVFDLRAVYVGGRIEDRPGVDLCAASELRFDGSTGAATASSR
ncbi:toll/interleukin-1 receptor domain-containing protein [Roseomonas terrae]|jgi:hypothetical protein|uniref:Toll/interleukin-1 receptor domain-containing protein n=1 Tax=Neoroseomonas terrae TaxID=424799 RepID=A0ABS5ENF3_9PROT|nr:toll/interleukin-1 receptor domain-containing protein [Neoroseomonas terrae]MBR0652558.1 toll/interleukin-1 receptor domain-containing protein [Neoroseomonas terrae]